MAAQVKRCDACQRLIATWVKKLGYTTGHNGKNYCRFCYVRLRKSGKIQPKVDDSKFLDGINWELDLIDEINQRQGIKQNDQRRGTFGQPGRCPACRSKLSFNLRGNLKAEGLCPKCNTHIQLLKSGAVKLFPTRASIILGVSQRIGKRPDAVEEIYSYLIDEISARLCEHPILSIPELGIFQVKHSGKVPEIEFKPSPRLLARFAAGCQREDVRRLFAGNHIDQ